MMQLANYFQNQFREDLKRIPVSVPNDVILQNPHAFFVSKSTVFFGGAKWETFNEDILLIPEDNRENFMLCLLIIVTVDYFSVSYSDGKVNSERSEWPKFGWCGYGPHFEHPYWIAIKFSGYSGNNENFLRRKNEINELFDLLAQLNNTHEKEKLRSFILEDFLNLPDELKQPVYYPSIGENIKEDWKELIKEILG